MADEEFYEEDEPVEEIVAAFERGEKVLTAPSLEWIRRMQAEINAYELAHTNAWNWNPITGQMEPLRSNGVLYPQGGPS